MSQKTQSISGQVLQRDLNKALILHQEQEFGHAEKMYKEILAVVPDHAEALNLLASVQLAMENYKEALAHAQKAIYQDNNRADFYLTLGYAEKAHGNFNQALNAYQCAQALAPNEAVIYECLGDLYQEQEEWGKSLGEYQKFLDQKPNDAPNLFKMAKAYEMEKDFEKAITCYDDVLAIDSSFLGAYLRKGNIFKANGQAQAALNQYLLAFAHDKKSAGILNNIGSAYYDLKDYKQAESYFKKAIDCDEGNLDAHLNIALVYKGLGEWEEALVYLKVARKLSPQSPTCYFYMAKIYFEEGDYKSAERFFIKCLDFDPNYYHAQNLLSQLYMKQGKFEKACHWAQKSFELAPCKETLINYLLPLKANKKYDLARDLFEQNKAQYRESESLNIIAGNIYQSLHDNAQAKFCFEQALKINSKNVSVQHLISALSGETVGKAPTDYVKDLFDGYSEYFDEQLTSDLHYKTPWVIADLLQEAFEEDHNFEVALDLGCGTGLSGQALKDMVKLLDGVDLSQKMLDKAAEKEVYRQLVCEDIESYVFAQDKESYDLAVATDVFVYLGDLDKVFAGLKKCLVEGAYFAFSTELLENNGDYKLRESGRFAHNPSYILDLATKHDFQLLKSKTTKLRQSSQGWILGEIYLLKS